MQLTMDGALTAVDDQASRADQTDVGDEAEETASLRSDVHCILKECHRDRGLSVFRDGVDGEAIAALAEVVARRLAPRIGGRYVQKGPYRAGWEERAARDAAVWKAWNGRNREEVMRQFGISRRLLYSILARRRKVGG